MKTGAIIVAAGRGTRMGGIDKCAMPIAGQSLLCYSITALDAVTENVVVVVALDQIPAWRARKRDEGWKVRALAAGGADRSASVRNGLEALRAVCPDVELVIIHDGARPLVTPDLATRCLDAAALHGAAIVAAPLTDTIKRVRDQYVVETLDRSVLWGAQTPQCFRADLLDAAFAWGMARGSDPFTDEAAMVEAYGHPVAIVPTDGPNLKMTTPADLVIADALIRARKETA